MLTKIFCPWDENAKDLVKTRIWNTMICVFFNKFCQKSILRLLWQIFCIYEKYISHLNIFIFDQQSLSSGDFDQFLGPPCSLGVFHPHNCWQDNCLEKASGHQLQKRSDEGNCQWSLLRTRFTLLGGCSWSAWPSSSRTSAAVPDIAMQSHTFKRRDASLLSLGWNISTWPAGWSFTCTCSCSCSCTCSCTCTCTCTWPARWSWKPERDENPSKVHLQLNSCLVSSGFISNWWRWPNLDQLSKSYLIFYMWELR